MLKIRPLEGNLVFCDYQVFIHHSEIHENKGCYVKIGYSLDGSSWHPKWLAKWSVKYIDGIGISKGFKALALVATTDQRNCSCCWYLTLKMVRWDDEYSYRDSDGSFLLDLIAFVLAYTWLSTLWEVFFCWSLAHGLFNWSWGDHHTESFFFQGWDGNQSWNRDRYTHPFSKDLIDIPL